MRERRERERGKKEIFLPSRLVSSRFVLVDVDHCSFSEDIAISKRTDRFDSFPPFCRWRKHLPSIRFSPIWNRTTRIRAEEAETKSKDTNAFHCSTTVGLREEISREAVRVRRWTSGSFSLIEFNRDTSEGSFHRDDRSDLLIFRLDLVSKIVEQRRNVYRRRNFSNIIFFACLLIDFFSPFLSVCPFFRFATQWKICPFRSTVNWNCQTKNSHHSVLIRCECANICMWNILNEPLAMLVTFNRWLKMQWHDEYRCALASRQVKHSHSLPSHWFTCSSKSTVS